MEEWAGIAVWIVMSGSGSPIGVGAVTHKLVSLRLTWPTVASAGNTVS